MKSTASVLFAGLCAALVIGLGHAHPFGNPRIEPGHGLSSLLVDAGIPANAKNVLVAKCADCHSNETRWPIYAGLAPGSWLIERDIIEGRKHMNLSHWQDLSPDAQEVMRSKIVAETRSGHMPPLQYRLIHWGANLSAADLLSLKDLTDPQSTQAAQSTSNQADTGTPNTSSSLQPADAARGKAVFEKRCTGCHALEADREGPRLAGVFGRKTGSISGFTYSDALKKSNLTWTEANLERWLTDPDLTIPGNNMSFALPKPQERTDLIAFLKTLP
ncbi:MAG TPA: heme-binding domain-containing protein [Acidobacteriaceae bacterium]